MLHVEAGINSRALVAVALFYHYQLSRYSGNHPNLVSDYTLVEMKYFVAAVTFLR
jgi:hypothetical protein